MTTHRFEKIVHGDPFINQHVAMITGQRSYTRPYTFKDNKTGKEYSHITGAFQFAEPGRGLESYCVVVGIPANQESVTFQCLEEFATEDELQLYRKMQEWQKEYEFIEIWWGEVERLLSLHDRYNTRKSDQILVSDFASFYEKDRFQLYLIQLQTDLQVSNKVLYLNDCNYLKNKIRSTTFKGKPKMVEHPALVTIAGLVHTLETYRSWERAVKKEILIPTKKMDEREAEIVNNSYY